MPLTNKDVAVMDAPEKEVRDALAAYKLALMTASYCNWMHRLACKFGDEDALRKLSGLERAEAHAREVANRSPQHRAALRLVVNQQPIHVREQDGFAAFLSHQRNV